MIRSFVLVLVLLAPQLAFAKAEGVDSRKDFPPLGCGSSVTGEAAGCHFQDANPQLMVSIDGPAALPVGDFAFLYTASIPQDSFGLMGAGINVHIDRPEPTGCQLEEFAPAGKISKRNDTLDPADYVLSHFHSGDPPPANLVGVWSYQFLVKNCASPGKFILRVAMNAFDGSGDEAGEEWNSSTVEVTVPEPAAGQGGAAALAAVAAVLAVQKLVRRRRTD